MAPTNHILHVVFPCIAPLAAYTSNMSQNLNQTDENYLTGNLFIWRAISDFTFQIGVSGSFYFMDSIKFLAILIYYIDLPLSICFVLIWISPIRISLTVLVVWYNQHWKFLSQFTRDFVPRWGPVLTHEKSKCSSWICIANNFFHGPLLTTLHPKLLIVR